MVDLNAINETPFAQRLIKIELGQASWPEPGAKRHHFIPQFMLNRFAKDDKRIFQLDRSTGRPQSISIDVAASRRHLYRFEIADGHQSTVVEGLLGMVEEAAAPALARLEEADDISDVDRASIAVFLAYLWARTPVARRGAERASEDIRLSMIATEIADQDAFHEKLERLGREHDELRTETREEAEVLRRSMLDQLKRGEVRSEDPDGGYTTGLLLDAAAELSMDFFADMRWTLLKATSGKFVTSDRGFVSVDPAPPHPWSSPTPRSSASATTYFPISSRHCIAMCSGDPEIAVREISRKELMEVNLRIYGWAERFVFGSDQQAVVAVRRAAKTAKPGLVVDPQPPRLVTLIQCDPSDDRLARAHKARGWPPYLRGLYEDGWPELFDYMVIGEHGTAVEIGLSAEDLVDERARKREGCRAGERPFGSVRVKSVHPSSIAPTQ